ncbi:MAG: cytochrome c biogenesis protein CcsA [bacterium]|nr:cytochrome c biogenesis protein CcsA [bacterium]
MNTVLAVLTILLPFGYLAVWADYLWLFYTDDPRARRTCSRAGAVLVLLHMAALVVRGLGLQRLPMGTQSEFLGALALAVLGTYLVVERRLRAKQTGFLTTGAAALMMGIASLAGPGTASTSPLLHDPGFAGHAVLVLLAYTALSLSFLYAILYLVLARQLIRRRFGLLFRRLPALETLERMSVLAVEMGVPLLFLSLALGHLWMYDLAKRVPPQMAAMLSPWDPKILLSWVIFLAYTAGLVGHRFWGWRGRRMNIMAVAAFVAVVLGMGAVHHFFPTFHKFPTLDGTAPADPLESTLSLLDADPSSRSLGEGR